MNNKTLIEKLEFILEGKTTGGDIKATADRVGKWYKGIKPDAKPGEKGYMRKRNVPPTKSTPHRRTAKYDPTKHEAPVKGKPLRYMKPQHKDYAKNAATSAIRKIAIRNAIRDTPKAGNIHKRHKEKMDRGASEYKKGASILKKHGALNPPLGVMFNKWQRGNSPQSKENPEGYVRSDKK